MKEKIISIVITAYLIIFMVLNIIVSDKEISYTERRKLSQFPKVDEKFTDNFEKYALDQFVLRDTFRSIKAFFNLNILHNKDNNKLVLKDDYIYKLEYPLNINSLNNFINMLNKINRDLDNKIYLSIIPDKSYFLSDEYLKVDYDHLFNELKNINDITYIPLNDILSIDDYYRTDTHWKQSSLIKVVDRLSTYMNFKYSNNYIINKYNNFKGVYYGQLGLNLTPDTLEYLTNNNINNANVSDLEHSNENKVYNIDKLNTFEPYDIYLNGSTPLITITNENCNSESELIIFRDSFGSSLSPLLIDSYSKITLVDLRYIDYNILSNYITIDDQDILFLYSTLVVNNSSTLKF